MTRKITRRDFLKLGVLGTGTVVLAGCKFPQRYVILEPYVHPPEEQPTGQDTWYASTCRQCPAGCGVIVRIMNGRALKMEGNPEHLLNQGKLCARGQAVIAAPVPPGPADERREPVSARQPLLYRGHLERRAQPALFQT